LEGEEEAGLAESARTLELHKNLLGGDLLINRRWARASKRAAASLFGNRGILGSKSRFWADPRLAQRSLRNWGAKSRLRTARLLASMKSDDGRVLIEASTTTSCHVGNAEKRALEEMPTMMPISKESSSSPTGGQWQNALLSFFNSPR